MKFNKLMYILSALAIIGFTGYRINSIIKESQRIVFNADRNELSNGVPVQVLEMQIKTDFLREPLSIENNHAFISASRIDKFSVGQRIGDGKIISISNDIDLDSGMYVMQTKNVSDGLNFAFEKHTGFFVPIYAINENNIMIDDNGIAKIQTVNILKQDSENALVLSGINNGDLLILSQIKPGQKIKINK